MAAPASRPFGALVLPQMRGGIAALTAILVLSTWGKFTIPLIFATNDKTQPLTVIITQFVGKYTPERPGHDGRGRALDASAGGDCTEPQPAISENDRGLGALTKKWDDVIRPRTSPRLSGRSSVATASRVLSGSDYPAAPKGRARECSRRLGRSLFSPNALSEGHGGRGGLASSAWIVGDASDPYFAVIVRGVEDVTRPTRYSRGRVQLRSRTGDRAPSTCARSTATAWTA